MAIKGCHTNNEIFNDSEFIEDLFEKQQYIRFSEAGASHQNRAEDCTAKTVVTTERTMLVHTALRCPEYILSTDIWPMVIDYSVWVHNRIPEM